MQTLAILQDSIRALRSRYLFWISLSISVMVAVALFGMISFNEQGWRILWFETSEHEFYRAGTDASRDLIAWIFNSVYVRWWLSWAAIALALISTASIVPDFLASGAIEVSLSKPISRLKLISLKFLGAMLFVALQVTVSVSLAWLLMGVKIGVWLPAAFWAIPLITLQFFYLYSVATLVGVLTRSTLASLLITLLFWGTCSISQFSANQIDSNLAQMDASAAQMDRRIERTRSRAEAEGRDLSLMEEHRIEAYKDQRKTFTSITDMLRQWQRATRTVEILLPKTADIQKILANKAQAPVLNELVQRSDIVRRQMQSVGVTDDQDIDELIASGLAGQRAIRAVNAKASILTSMIMPLFALLGAGLIFLRRDY